ncbi:TPA: hypothetical protein O5V50_002736, partial [Staphylococcus aureus]|nr:hypothetical protein [Staphylococcus aureus]HDA7699275.1 hypothetical protein [Staphylococcus aureus]
KQHDLEYEEQKQPTLF